MPNIYSVRRIGSVYPMDGYYFNLIRACDRANDLVTFRGGEWEVIDKATGKVVYETTSGKRKSVTEFRKSDRVKVKFEGTINYEGNTDDGRFKVVADGDKSFAWVDPKYLTLIAPAVTVGTLVSDISTEPPVGTVIKCNGNVYIRMHAGWYSTGTSVRYYWPDIKRYLSRGKVIDVLGDSE